MPGTPEKMVVYETGLAVGRAVWRRTVAMPLVPTGKVVAWVPRNVPGIPVNTVVKETPADGTALWTRTVANPSGPAGSVEV